MELNRYDRIFCQDLILQAQVSERRRAHHNVHESYEDPVQRLYVAMLPDSYVPPHKHTQDTKWELFMVVQGSIDVLLFDESGVLTDRHTLTAGGNCFCLQIPPNTWHATVCHEPVVFFEVKQGPYTVNNDKCFASWAPKEGDKDVLAFIEKMRRWPVGS